VPHWWNWERDEDTGVRTLYLDGVIAEESWFDDDVTPKAFKADLMPARATLSFGSTPPAATVSLQVRSIRC
jgi:hypothetical protein